jgi:hypothetical protein
VSTKDEDPRDFALVVMEIGKGRLHARLSEQLAAITAAVVETGKKGELTLKIEVKPPSKNAEPGVLNVTGTSTAKVPESDSNSPTSVFFADESGNLTRNDPRQMTLPFREPTTKGTNA